MTGDPIRVLLIEDNATDTILIRHLLSHNGEAGAFHVTAAQRLSEGVEYLASTEVDVVLLDLLLPDSSGIVTFTKLRNEAPEVPILVLSGLEDSERAVKAVSLGAQDYLIKDRVNPESLNRAIRYALERHRVQRAFLIGEERFRWLADYSAVGILLLQAEELDSGGPYAVTYANPALADMFDCASPVECARRMSLLDLAAEGSRGELDDAIQALFGGRRRAVRLTFEAQRGDGATFAAEMHMAVIDVDDEPAIVAMVVDVDHQHQREQTLRLRNRALAALNGLVMAVSHSLDLEETLQQALKAVMRLEIFDQEGKGAIFLRDPETGELQVRASLGAPDDLPCYEDVSLLETCRCGLAMSRRDLVIANSTSPELAHVSCPQPCREHVDICVPLLAGETLVGLMNLWVVPGIEVHEEDIDLITSMARQIAAAVERIRLYAETKRRSYELSVLSRTGQLIASTLDLDEVLMLIISEARPILQAERVSVLLFDTTRDELEFAAVAGPDAEVLEGAHVPLDAGLIGRAIRGGKPLLVPDVRGDGRHCADGGGETSAEVHSTMIVPMYCKGKFIGAIEAVNLVKRPFSSHELELLEMIAGYAAIAIENAQLYEAEREQRRLVERSRGQLLQSDRLAATGRLTASLVHELNNPLQALHSSLQMMLSFPLDAEERRSYIALADEEVERLIGMVNRVLEFSRRPSDEMAAVDLRRVILKVLDLSHKYLQHRHIGLKRDIEEELPSVWGNASRLGQVMLNLVINAVEAMPSGGTLSVSAAGIDEEFVRVTVADTGVGISSEIVDHIFEPFFSTKKQGTGLGLSISHSIVEEHGGDITVRSEIDEGTVFELRLPVCAEREL